MQMINAFCVQDIFFNKLKDHLLNTKILKIIKQDLKEQFILIESILEDSSSYEKKQFNVVLDIFPNSFDYKVLSLMLNQVGAAITPEDFGDLDNFVNVKLLNSFISSNKIEGFRSKVEFACFFSPQA